MAKPKENPHRIVTFLSDAQMDVLKRISKDNYDAPISSLVRRAVEEFVTRYAKKQK